MSSVVPEGWSRQKLGDSLIPRPKSKLPSGESNPLGYYDFYVCSHKVLKSFHDEYSSPSILFSTGGEASVHLATERYAFSTDVWATEFEGDICNEYVFRLLEENIRTINYSGFQGSGIKHLDKSFIEKLEFSIPPLPEQKKIASILTSVDEVIENTQKQIDKLQDLKKATMNELLTKGIGHTEFKDSELGRIPKSWEVYELGKLCAFTQGVQISLDETLRIEKEGYIRYLYINDFSSEKNLRFIKDDFPTKIVTDKDLVMANTGHSAGTIFRGKHGVLSNNAFKISIKKHIKSEYLFYYLSTDNYWFNIGKLFNTAGQPHVGHGNIAKLQFICPPLDEQDNAISIIQTIDQNIHNKELKLSQTQSLKKSLMQDLLTGKVRVTVN